MRYDTNGNQEKYRDNCNLTGNPLYYEKCHYSSGHMELEGKENYALKEETGRKIRQ